MGSKNTVKTKDFIKVLVHLGLKLSRTNGSHQVWSRADLTRPVIVQATKKELPKFVLSNNCKTLGITVDDFFRILNGL